MLATGTFGRFSVQLSVPAGVDVGLRQFEPQFLAANMTIEPTPVGHVLMVSDVRTLAEGLDHDAAALALATGKPDRDALRSQLA